MKVISIPFLFRRFRITDGIDSPLRQACEGTNLSIQIPFRVFRDFPYVPLFLFWIILRTSGTGHEDR